jgi:hypothetical protein
MTPQMPVNAPPVFNGVVAKLSDAYARFLNTGVYEAINLDPLSHPNVTRRFFRVCAKEMKRPFVLKEDWAPWVRKPDGSGYESGAQGVYLYMPRQKRLDPLIAPLIMLCTKDIGPGYRYNHTRESSYRVGYHILEFWLRGEDGAQEHYQHMLARIRTNPTLRHIFKIPEEV